MPHVFRFFLLPNKSCASLFEKCVRHVFTSNSSKIHRQTITYSVCFSVNILCQINISERILLIRQKILFVHNIYSSKFNIFIFPPQKIIFIAIVHYNCLQICVKSSTLEIVLHQQCYFSFVIWVNKCFQFGNNFLLIKWP